MSIIRWSSNSSLYIFHHSDGYVTCFACPFLLEFDAPLTEDGFPLVTDSFNATDVEEMVAHVIRHRDAGDDVPDWLEDKIRERWPENFDE